VLGAVPVTEGRSAHVVITVSPALGPGPYLVCVFDTRNVPTPGDTPRVSPSVTVTGP